MPVFNIPQGPDYGEFGRSMAGIIRSQEKPWDMEKSIMSIRAMSEQLAHEQEMFPLKLEQMQMENRLTSDKVKAFEIENSPERLNAAADLKMQEDSLRVKSMQETFNQRQGVEAFNEKYAPMMMKAIASGNMDDFASFASASLNDPNAKYMTGHVMEMKKMLTEQQKADVEGKILAHQMSEQEKAWEIKKKLMDLKRQEEESVRPTTEEEKRTGGLKYKDLAMGGKSGPITDTQANLAQLSLGAWAQKRLSESSQIWKAQNKPYGAMLESIAKDPTIGKSLLGEVTDLLFGEETVTPTKMGVLHPIEATAASFGIAGTAIRHPVEAINEPGRFLQRIANKNYAFFTSSDTDAFKMQYVSATKMLDSADDNIRDMGKRKLDTLLDMFQDPRTLDEEHRRKKAAQLQKEANALLSEASTLSLYTPTQQLKMDVAALRPTRAGTQGYEETITDAFGNKKTIVRTPTGSVAVSGGTMTRSVDVAKDYIRRAGGDVEKAKEMAAAEGVSL